MRRVLWAIVLGCCWASSVLAFVEPPLVDDCNRTENPLVSGWQGTWDPDAAGTWSANGTICVSTGNAATYWGTLQPANHKISAIMADAITTTTNYEALYVRIQEPSDTFQTVDGYSCRFSPGPNVSGPEVTIRRHDNSNGTPGTVIAGPVPLTITSGDGIGCQIIEDTITLWHQPGGTGNWQLVLSANSTTYSGPGYAGLFSSTATLNLDTIGIGPVTTTRLGLLHTEEEKAIWQQRITTGPYNTDDYAAIAANALSWRNAPTARPTGPAVGTCYDGSGTTFISNRATDSGMLDAAFVYLLTGDTSYSTVVKQELLEQTTIPGTNFADTSTFCPTVELASGLGTNSGPWVFRLLLSYDYIKDTMTSAERTIMRDWFHASAVYFNQMIDLTLVKRFPGRLSDNYTCTTVSSICPGSDLGITHFGGPMVASLGRGWNNIEAQMAVNVAAIGVLVDDVTLKDRAKRYFKEWLAYATYPGGVQFDQYRWIPSGDATQPGTFLPQRGYYYPASTIGSMELIAEVFGRTGDLSLHTYSTTTGLYGSTDGSAKTLLLVMQLIAGQTNNTILQYASTVATSDATLLIDSNGPITAGGQRGENVYLSISNPYFQDASVKTAYMLPFPSGHDQSGYSVYKGPWGTLPGVRFMYGQMEGVVWPYAPVEPAEVYVDNTESCPGTGSTIDPYCSIQLALNQALAGQVIKIRTGTGVYDQYATITSRHGTLAAPITVEPDTAAAFILRNCDPGAAEAALEIIDSDYWVVRGLTFDGVGCGTVPSRYALKLQGITRDITGVKVLNNTFRNWRQTTGATDGPQALYLAGCDTALGCGANKHAIGATVQGNTFENIDLTAMRLIRTQGTLVADNTIDAMRCGRQGSGGPAETIGIHYTHSNTTLTLRSNTIANFTSYLSCPLTSQGVATVAGIWCDTGGGADSNNIIERNVIHDLDDGKADLANAAGTSHSASGIFIEEQCAGTLVMNNVLYDIGTYGIRNAYNVTGGTSHIANEYYHNSLYDMLEPLYFKEGVATIKNNLISNCRGVCIKNDDDSDNVLTIDSNLYSDGATQTKIGQISPGAVLDFTAWKAACSCDAASINANPQFTVLP